jgi:S-DNA-T family DNA segregation ATPase FtsK/SpoIIIE
MAGKGNVLKNKPEAVAEAELDEKPEKVKQPKLDKKISQRKEKVDKPSFQDSGVVKFLEDERTFKISGLFLLLVSAFLLIAFTSYFFTWKQDQSLVEGSWFDLLRFSDKKVDNWLGKMGAIASHQFMHTWFGLASFAFVLLAFLTGFKILFKADLMPLKRTIRYSIFSLLYLPPALSFIVNQHEELLYLGGGIGYQMNMWLNLSLGAIGTGFLMAFVGLSFAVAVFNFEFKLPKRKVQPAFADTTFEETAPIVVGNKIKEETPMVVDLDDADEEDELLFKNEDVYPDNFALPLETTLPIVEKLPNPEIELPTSELELDIKTDDPHSLEVAPVINQINDNTEGMQVVSDEEVNLVEQLGEYDPTLDLSSYQYPTLDLLENYTSSRSTMSREELMAELEANKKRIIETLGHYDIEIDKIKATVGPTVTLFEIVPKAGIRISKIKNLEDDIALSLAALGIRIIAPIPGKGTIGIEVPNQHPDMVSMRSIMASEKFQNTDYDLPIALGKTISNEIFVADLAKMPHLLMAGATGQGKSVGLNAILVSLLYKKHPAQVKFVLVDPKKVELTLFKTIERHFLAKLPGDGDAIITDTKKVVNTVNSLCVEMDNRYELLKDAQVRNIKEYNAKFISRKLNPNNGHRFLPYIVLVVDEFADLIMTAGKEIETPIARLAQLARAIGIHLIIATQRPSVNIITGTIKANFPARLAFKVTSKIDSRTILDTGGADQLIGRGDMLLSNGADLIRVQCAFVDTPEVDAITSFIGNQRGYSDAYLLPEYVGEGESSGSGNDIGADDFDPLFDEAAHMVVQFQQGSASLLQRRLKLGYNRAGRLVDQLEAAGIIGPFEGSKAREVRCKDLASLEQLLKSMRSPTGV